MRENINSKKTWLLKGVGQWTLQTTEAQLAWVLLMLLLFSLPAPQLSLIYCSVCSPFIKLIWAFFFCNSYADSSISSTWHHFSPSSPSLPTLLFLLCNNVVNCKCISLHTNEDKSCQPNSNAFTLSLSFFSCLKDEASEGTEVKIKYP